MEGKKKHERQTSETFLIKKKKKKVHGRSKERKEKKRKVETMRTKSLNVIREGKEGKVWS